MQTFDDAEQILTGIYAGLMSSSLFSGTLTVMPDIQADLAYAVENFSNVYGPAWLWNLLSTDQDVESVYAALYGVISRCNFFLERVDARSSSRRPMYDNLDAYLDSYTGEVYTIRALCYSKLIECFCKAYDPATAENELGVVLRSKYSDARTHEARLAQGLLRVRPGGPPNRAEEVLDNDYDQYNSIYASAAAAQALHARVALYMQDYPDGRRLRLEGHRQRGRIPAGRRLLAVHHPARRPTSTYMWALRLGLPRSSGRSDSRSTSYGGALGQVFLNANRDYHALPIPTTCPHSGCSTPTPQATDLRYERLLPGGTRRAMPTA